MNIITFAHFDRITSKGIIIGIGTDMEQKTYQGKLILELRRKYRQKQPIRL